MATAITLYKEVVESTEKAEIESEIKSVEKELTKMKQAAGGTIN